MLFAIPFFLKPGSFKLNSKIEKVVLENHDYEKLAITIQVWRVDKFKYKL